MNTIGNVAKRVLGRRYLWPDIAFHPSGYTAVNPAYAVMKPGALKAQTRHVEALITVFATQPENGIEFQPGVVQKRRQEVLHKVAGGEDVVARRHRSMGGKQGASGYRLEGGTKRQPFGHGHTAPFQYLEGCVALVDMPHRRLNTQCGQNRVPPMPSSISWLMRVAESPP